MSRWSSGRPAAVVELIEVSFHVFRHQLRRAPAALTVAALALTLAPAGAAAGSEAGSPADPATPEESSATLAETAEQPAKQVRLRIGPDQVRTWHTDRVWATRVLREAQVKVRNADLVRVRRDGTVMRKRDQRRVRDGDTIQVVRVNVRTRVKRNRIKPRTVRVKTARLRPGARKVAAKGRPGVRRVKVTVKLHNTKVVRKKRAAKVVRRPKPRRVLVGTAARSVPGADRLNWRALANCESSGNPRAVNPAGYYGLYQFDTGTWRSVGGRGLPSKARPAEQTYRAKLLYKQRGRQPWPHCGRYL